MAVAVLVIGALGAGLALSAGLSRRWLARWLGLMLMRRASKRFGHVVWDEIAEIWKDSTPDKNRRGTDNE